MPTFLRLILAAMGVFFIAQTRAAVPLAESGRSLAVIVHNGHTQVARNLAANHVRQGHIRPPAEELAHYLEQITGAEFVQVESLAAAGQRPAIVLALVDKVPGAGEGPAGQQAYCIRTAGNRITLTASTPLGLHYAVYGLLEDHLGCRFYGFARKGLSYAGPGFEVVPKRSTLVLPATDELQQPAFASRGVIFWPGSYPWILKNRGAGLPGDHVSGAVAAGHNLYHLLPPHPRNAHGEEVPGLFAEHPDFYPMNPAGEREPGWAMGICGTNPKLPTLLAAALEREIQLHVERAGDAAMDWSRPFSAAQGDGFAGCHCNACRKLVHTEESEAAPLILALNRALDILAQKYPKARVSGARMLMPPHVRDWTPTGFRCVIAPPQANE